MPPGYIVITPARNEGENIGHTIASMAAQSHRPSHWVIVNDGSSDCTGEVIDAAAREHPWILPFHRKDRGFRQQGGGVIEAFYDGYALLSTLKQDPRVAPRSDETGSHNAAPHHSTTPSLHDSTTPWGFLVKFDADLSFGSDYFARCLAKFTEEPKLGIGGGMISREHNGRLVCESPGDPLFHVRGATKIYRRECWEAIGGLVRAPGWDTIDELKANMLRWRTLTFRDIPLRHHRFTGSADGTWKNSVKFGLSNYITGYHPLFMLAKCLKRLFEPPYLVGSLGLGWGFCRGYLQGLAQVDDRDLIRYVRRQQINKLLLRPSLWG